VKNLFFSKWGDNIFISCVGSKAKHTYCCPRSTCRMCWNFLGDIFLCVFCILLT